MQKVKIVAVGRLRDAWLRDGLAEYLKRLGGYCAPEVVEIPECRLPDRPGRAEIERALDREGAEILKKCDGAQIVPLCVEGKELSSAELAQTLEQLRQRGGEVCFVIGSSYGLSEAVKRAGTLRLSLSRMTLPHALARVVLAEQLYRGFSILAGGKYDK